MTNELRAAAEQALDILDSEWSLESGGEFCRWCGAKRCDPQKCQLEQTLIALRAALAAEQPQPVSAWHAVADWLRDNYQDHPTISDLCDAMVAAAPPPPAAEPVTWGVDWGRNGDRACVSIVKRLADGTIEVVATEYAAPPAAEPTDAMVDAALEAMHGAPVGYMFPPHQHPHVRAKMRAALAAAAKERG